MTKQETKQRLEWVKARQAELREQKFVPYRLIEFADLKREQLWLEAKLTKKEVTK
jgi:hypothetical protein